MSILIEIPTMTRWNSLICYFSVYSDILCWVEDQIALSNIQHYNLNIYLVNFLVCFCTVVQVQTKFDDFLFLYISGTTWCINEQSIFIERIKIQVEVENMLADMEDCQLSEYSKRATCIMTIQTRCQNTNIMTVVQCSLHIVKAIRCDMDNCEGAY